MISTRRRSGALLLGFVTGSLVLHAAVLTLAPGPGRPPVAALEPAEQTLTVSLVAPTPEPTPPPLPAPTPEPTPPPTPVLAAEESLLPPAPTPAPTPAATPRPAATPATAPRKKTPPPSRARTPQTTAPLVEARPDVPRNRPPAYPEIARRSGWQGRVLVRVSLSAEGRVTGVTLHRGSGFGVLDQSALQTVRGWRFLPRQVGGRPVPAIIEVPVYFSLRRQ